MKKYLKDVSYEHLKFDSNLFGYKVAKINKVQMDKKTLKVVLSELSGDGVKLVYWAINPRDARSNLSARENGGLLVDEKITFIKSIGEDEYGKDTRIISYFGHELNQNLVRLAFQSGEYSRFKIDKNFKNNEFEKLYEKWIENSLKRVIAKDVLVYIEGNVELGIVTIGEKNGKADIGILAVDENSRGKSIGTKLVNAAFSLTKKWGFGQIQVVTQGKNEIACRFYERLGFKIEKMENIYHIWL